MTTAFALTLCFTTTGCQLFTGRNDEPATYDHTYDQPQYPEYGADTSGAPATHDTEKRLEETWGPGEYAALLTGTVSSKDRNFFLNLPLASWYVRKQDRKGVGLLGGAIAYDMVSVKREQGAPVSEKLTSHGLLGLAGNITERSLDGSGTYRKSHWLFPFYRYYEENGERTVYPLMLFPWSLRPKNPTLPPYNPAPWNTANVAPIDPPQVQAQTAIGDTSIVASPPRTVEPARDWSYNADLERPRRVRTSAPPTIAAPVRTTSSTGIGTLRPRKSASVPKSPPVREQPERASSEEYTVRKGDTLYSISRRFYGSGKEWRRIYDANRGSLASERSLKIGQRLSIPQ